MVTPLVTELDRKETVGTDGLTVERTFLVDPYSARGVVYDALMGGVAIVGGNLIRTPPARDPWFPWCFCQSVECDPFEVLNSPENVPSGLAILAAKNYSQRAKLTASFSTPKPNQPTQPTATSQSNNEDQEKELASESWDFAGQNITLKNNYWKFPGDDVLLGKDNVAVTKTLPKVGYTLVRHYCLRIPYTAMTLMYGRVNKSNFRTPRFTWFPEMMRFDGGHVSHKFTIKGEPWYEIQYAFMNNPIYDQIDGPGPPITFGYVGWNRLLREDKGWWEKPVSVADPTRTIYQYDEDAPSQTIRGQTVKGFSLLFNPGAT